MATTDDLMRRAEQAAQQWRDEHEDRIEGAVKEILDNRLQQIVAKLLGFDHHWGAWEVDHCNGRHGESAAGDWIRERAGTAVYEWLDKQAGALPALPKTAIKGLHYDYLKKVEVELRAMLSKHAVQTAREECERIVKKAGK